MAKLILNRLKVVLFEKGVTGRELAKRIEKAESTVSLWCTNESQPSLRTLHKIAQYLDVDIRELITPTKKKKDG